MARRYPDNPLVGVGVVIIDGARVVMCRRANPPRQGGWSLPGGGQELGETIEQAAIREALEETALEVEILGLVEVIDSIERDAGGAVEYHYTLIDVAARVVSGTLQAGDDAASVRWVTIEELRALDTWPTTIDVVEKAITMFGPAMPDEGAGRIDDPING